MKKFFGEFKKFITRGNVLDMSVGIIVGGAFTAIVNGLSNFVLKPITNWLLALILGKNSLSNIVTFLGTPAYKLDAAGAPLIDATTGLPVVDLANSFYIDWGSFINAIINFFLVALVLFTIVKVINKAKENNEKFQSGFKKLLLSKEDKKELKKRGIKRSNRKLVNEYLEEKERLEQEKLEQEKLAQEEKARLDRLANPTEVDLLKQIKELLEKQNA